MSRAKPEGARGSRCPMCGRPARPEHWPFCSRGCRDRDLIAWLDGGRAIPGPPADPGGDPDGDPDGGAWGN